MNASRTTLVTLIAVTCFGLSSAAMAAKGLCKDGTPPPCKPDVELTNNLSVPAVHTVDTPILPVWNVPGGTLNESYSFGCDIPESVGNFSYPNTSCVDYTTGLFLTAEACTAVGGPCAGYAVDRIYWQKVDINDWWAESQGPVTPVTAAYLDWGDNLESVSWSERSIIRVETTPWASLLPWNPTPYDPTLETCEEAAIRQALDPELVCLLGYQMWHAFGQGPTELWGVRATLDTYPVPYAYLSPFAVIHTSGAHINIAKLEAEAETCPTAPGGTPPTGFYWDDSLTPPQWQALVAEDDDPCLLRDTTFTSELNVGGRYVYGYNWTLKRDALPTECSDWAKSGWWRLTYYTEDGDVFFDPANPVVEPLAAPPSVPAAPGVMTLEADEEGALYVPVIDYADNLTYIDICIEPKTGGGGGGGGQGGNH